MGTIRLLLSAVLLALTVSARSQTPDVAPAIPVETAPPVPLLWKISDADNSVYVLGSFHMLKPGDYPLSNDVDAAFADAEHVMFEMSPEEMSSPTLGLQMGQAAMRTDGTTLDSELSPELAERLKTWAAANAVQLQTSGLPASALQMFKPWFVGLLVSLTEMSKMGLDPKLGLDQHFATAAKTAGKSTEGLETGTEQIAFLSGMQKEEQLQMLAEALDESEDGPEEMEKLHRQWREGDAQGIWQGMAADMQARYPRLYQRINVQRNDAWVPRIEERLKSETDDTLIVVGALHLLGEDGIVEKLRARGYNVERLCTACNDLAPAPAGRVR